MFPYPKTVPLAHTPSRIEYLERLSKRWGGPEIYIKRDDDTSCLLSGNKVRKLEFFLADAQAQGADTLVTCGGIQSNHARATAIAAKRAGLDCHLILRGKEIQIPDGNYLLDLLVKSKITFVTKSQYLNRDQIFDKVEKELTQKGRRPYSIPEGGSNGLGALGYVKAMEEIRDQINETGLQFNAIVLAVGSGGTYTGLWIGKKFFHIKADIIGFNIAASADYFREKIFECAKELENLMKMNFFLTKEEIQMIDGYVGKGYGKSRPEEMALIKEVAQREGIILDPIYTGKAMVGLADQIKKGRFKKGQKVLFLHTGGIFGLFPYREWFKKNQKSEV
ncbi:MAG: D-cysteine desulfhydrase family protein [Syntrophaceae bacterium]|nr:D-cysteine desulfhydrase family protein [Syntrophaceae bacterium]